MLKENSGFTLLEVIIALGILAIILGVTYSTQSSNIISSARSKNVIIATNLARNKLNELEIEYEGQSFDSLSPKESGEFEEQKGFKWTRTVEKVDFSSLTQVLMKAEKDKEKDNDNTQSETLAKLFQEYLGNSVRRLTLTVEWPDGAASTSMTFSELLVTYDAQFAPGI